MLIRTWWRRPIGCLKLDVVFCNRFTNYRALLQKMTYEDKASYGSSPPCTDQPHTLVWHDSWSHVTWLIHLCRRWCVTWLIHMCRRCCVTWLIAKGESPKWVPRYTCVKWHVVPRDVTHSHPRVSPIWVPTYMCVFRCVRACVCMYEYTHKHTHTYVCVCVCVCECMHTHIQRSWDERSWDKRKELRPKKERKKERTTEGGDHTERNYDCQIFKQFLKVPTYWTCFHGSP